MNDSEWNTALARWFLQPASSGRPLYLWVDEEALEQIARERIADCSGSPVEDFERALRTYAPPRRLFRPWRGSLDRWESGGRVGDPPFLTALGATVLAASRRGLGKGGAGQASYYRELWKIFGRDGDAMPDMFDEDVPRMWRAFNHWLAEDLGGTRGLPTAKPPDGYWPYIGWAVSQALLTGYDRSNLTRFFVAIGLEPRTEISVDEALLRFIHWERSGGEVSQRLKTALADPNLQKRVGEVIVSQLARWDGSRRDQVGRRILTIAATLDAGRGRRLGLAVLVPQDFQRVSVQSPRGALDLDPGLGYAAVPGDVSAADLENGLSWRLPELTLERRGRMIIPFTPDDRMNRWSSVERVELGQEHFVLAHSTVASSVEALLRLRAPEARRTDKLKVPDGWVCFRGVVIDNQNPNVPSGLEALVPRPREIPGLVGGLRLVPARRVYLTGGAPDLSVPGVGGHPLAVRLDGRFIKEASGDIEVISLEATGVGAGDHLVEVESLRMAFTSVDHFQDGPTRPLLGHGLRRRPGCWIISGPPGDLDGQADLEISGARLIGDPAVLPAATSSRMVKADASRYLAITKGLTVVPLAPSQPSWASALGLPFNSFELDPELQKVQIGFDDVWVIIRVFKRRAQVVEVNRPAVSDISSVPSSLREVLTDLGCLTIDFADADADDARHMWDLLVGLASGRPG